MENKVKVSVGLRYFKDDRAHEDLLPSTVEVLTALGLDANRSKTYNQLSPRFNVSFTPTDNILVYATLANGFRSGIIQGGGNLASAVALGVTAPTFVDEENVWSYELGSKIELADGKVTLEGAAYYNNRTDMQVFTVDIVEQNVFVLYENVPDGAAAYGFDWNMLYSSPSGFNLGFNGNINNTEYSSDLPGISGITEGSRVDYVPQSSFGASVGYSFPVGKNLKGVIYSNIQHSSPLPETNGEFREGDPMTMLDGRLGVEAKNWGIFLYGKNLLNEDGYLYRSSQAPIDRRIRPLNFGVNLKLNFTQNK